MPSGILLAFYYLSPFLAAAHMLKKAYLGVKDLGDLAPCCIYCQCQWNEQQQGIFIKGNFICAQCEQKLITTSCEQPQYHYYMNGLKKIWRLLEL